MSDTDTETPETGTAAGPRSLNAKQVRRRAAKIAGGQNGPRAARMHGKLAIRILEAIAAGEVKNPRAAARAFLAGRASEAEPEAEADQTA
ncbi:hypothetical protein [Litorisediminicola beolgyonensis]|uniref:Uncharacterized protein n=1 Tax=Litorisediminicola beolgyonensis TaxID=1173614 RepID=A0ABW3ZMT3_9RHOB